MTGKFDNKRKEGFLSRIPNLSLDAGTIVERCKLNFSYFDNSQPSGQDFTDWSNDELLKLIDKFKHYTKSSLEFWRNERTGSGGLKVLEIYGKFPKRSEFTHPKHVPHDVQWARFRLESKVRMIGFVIPRGFECHDGVKLKEPFDFNTFYVVFLDRNHKFYLTEED
ncbi:hypothetical protein ACQV2E_11325 [Pantoea allii]|uniref:hypothetical protein n=1 Tax=Pantoea allii TaxID=574096 RepID=UPI003D317F31